jgi:hypothetical protein
LTPTGGASFLPDKPFTPGEPVTVATALLVRNVARWELLAGASATTLVPVASVRRTGFETAMTLHSNEPLLAVQARDSAGRVLATSTAIAPGRG